MTRRPRIQPRPVRPTVHSPQPEPRPFFLAYPDAPPGAPVATVLAEDALSAARLAGAALLRWWQRQEDLVLFVTRGGERGLAGPVDWEGEIPHAVLWSGFTPAEAATMEAVWAAVTEILVDPKGWRRRIAATWEGYEE